MPILIIALGIFILLSLIVINENNKFSTFRNCISNRDNKFCFNKFCEPLFVETRIDPDNIKYDCSNVNTNEYNDFDSKWLLFAISSILFLFGSLFLINNLSMK